MKDFIEFVESHTNHEKSEEAAHAGFMALVVAGLIYCITLLI